MKTLPLVLFLTFSLGVVSRANAATNMARAWNERTLVAIRMDTPHPPGQARNLFSLSACLYDAWAACDTNGAVGFVYRAKHTATNVAAARDEEMA